MLAPCPTPILEDHLLIIIASSDQLDLRTKLLKNYTILDWHTLVHIITHIRLPKGRPVFRAWSTEILSFPWNLLPILTKRSPRVQRWGPSTHLPSWCPKAVHFLAWSLGALDPFGTLLYKLSLFYEKLF